MRRLFLVFTGLALFAGWAPLRAAEVELVRVWPLWRTAESFERIGEYFGRPEQHWKQTVLRSHPAERAGFYFLVRLKNATALPAAKFEVSVVSSTAPEPKTTVFSAAVSAGETVFNLGLTGADWTGGKDAHPVAWKVALLTDDGRVLGEQSSFLWEKPAK
jgi:hypothetical protein